MRNCTGATGRLRFLKDPMRYFKLLVSKKGLSVLRALQGAIVLFVVIAVAYHGYGLYKTVASLRGAQKAAAKQSAAITTLTSRLSASTDTPVDLLAVEPPLESGKFMSTFIRQIKGLSTSTGSKLNSIKPKAMEVALDSVDQKNGSTETLKFKPIEVDLEMLTDFAGMNTFVADLSKLPKVVKLTHFDVARLSADPASRRITLQAKLKLLLCMLEPVEKST